MYQLSPDSEIVKNTLLGKTKSLYFIKHGIFPYLKRLLEDDIKKSDSYVISFVESLNDSDGCGKWMFIFVIGTVVINK